MFSFDPLSIEHFAHCPIAYCNQRSKFAYFTDKLSALYHLHRHQFLMKFSLNDYYYYCWYRCRCIYHCTAFTSNNINESTGLDFICKPQRQTHKKKHKINNGLMWQVVQCEFNRKILAKNGICTFHNACPSERRRFEWFR